jgi:hypothetical protein
VAIAILRILIFGSGLLAISTAVVFSFSEASPSLLLTLVIVAVGAGMCFAAIVLQATPSTIPDESEDIRHLSEERQRELIRGTSLFLRESNFRYSVRNDSRETGAKRGFNAEVNTVRLGFLPAAINDNTNDREGFGYVAFVYDGHRWCGPGLPCPADQTEAVRHAARCVSPLASEEETHFEGTSVS